MRARHRNAPLSQRLRITVVSHAYGVDEYRKVFELIAQDHDVTLFAPGRVNSPVFGDVTPPVSTSIHVEANETIPIGRQQHFFFRPSWRQYRSLRPSVIYIEYDPWTPEFWSFIAPASLLYPRTPVVLFTKKNTRHVSRGLAGVLERSLTWIGMKRIRVILAVSDKAAGVFQELGYGRKPIEIQAHIPIDETLFAPRLCSGGVGAPTLGFVGSIAIRKGVHTLVEAVRLVRERGGSDTTLVLVGPIEDDDLMEVIGSHPWIDYRGSIPNEAVPGVLSELDLFVMPSSILPDHEEHDAHALLEAMMMGLPCVGSESGIIPEVIHEGKNGWMCRPDDPAALADVIERVLPDRDECLRVGEEGRRTAVEFTGLESLVRRRIAAFEGVVRG